MILSVRGRPGPRGWAGPGVLWQEAPWILLVQRAPTEAPAIHLEPWGPDSAPGGQEQVRRAGGCSQSPGSEAPQAGNPQQTWWT